MKKDFMQEFRTGLEGYEYDIILLLRILRRYKKFSDQDFDRWFSSSIRTVVEDGVEYMIVKPPRVTIRLSNENTMMLGVGANVNFGDHEWAVNLHLLQIMISFGIVSVGPFDNATKSYDERVCYSWLPEGEAILNQLEALRKNNA